MNSCYVLIKETNLDILVPDKKPNPYRVTKTIKAFNDFETGKQQMHSILKSYATSKNPLFDGNGNILNLNLYDYINHFLGQKYEALYDEEEREEQRKRYSQLPNMLRSYLLNEEPTDTELLTLYKNHGLTISEMFGLTYQQPNFTNPFIPPDCWDYTIPRLNFDFEPASVYLRIDPYFYMDNPEETYVCYIEGEYEIGDVPFFLHLELKKVDIE